MKTDKSTCLAAVCFMLCLFSFSIPLSAQVAASPTISLRLDKWRGFNLFSDISGSFMLVASVSSDVIRVEFYLNNQLKLNDTTAPFQWEFDTTEYSLGQHSLEAIAHNGAGESAYASTTANFVESPFPPYFLLFLVPLFVFIILVVVLKLRQCSAWDRMEKAKGERPTSY